MQCIFCQIVEKKNPAKIVYEDEKVLGFEDIQPEAPIHLLFVPKKHIEWKDNFDEEDLSLLSKMISSAKETAIERNIFHACKLIFNIGKTGHISHVHLHLIGGWEKDIPMKNV